MKASVATWSFGLKAVQKSKENLCSGKLSLDATEYALARVENDVSTGVYIVGRGGFPNADGFLECDAALMDGNSLKFGAVMALRGIATPSRVARRVLENSPHSILVGEGAQQFALSQGFTVEKEEDLNASSSEFVMTSGHSDTLGVINLDASGNIVAGVSTSGMPGKHPGRVGDSPLPGGGLYADDRIGAASCTGDGDQILPFCPSLKAVLKMGQGMTPNAACESVIKEIAERIFPKEMFEIGIVALSVEGEYGAAGSLKRWRDIITGTEYKGFPYAVWNSDHCIEPTIKVVHSCLSTEQ
ncbi:hypothetical protein CAPTEDRAFT_191352 [Capitella teleta]|uniref:N(4)-(Beta-N-acetylglucosaminyl)-L-asparaginase n=1 Tax=Capitella teleta TaxID=283909 RepID=R7TCD6_CAPTE|nr:hypothetical protein CAPTEDRAFT_191352 [Capitella teleta]|eukprot:ELT91383.1 hypothetical protein CAPTEDRAFT_191352 [Capitella teleta]